MNTTPATEIVLETERLLIFPLTYDQLVMYLHADNSLETALKLAPSVRTIPPELLEPLEQNILPAVADPAKNHLYYTLWTIISKHENIMVADICFKGEPNINGEIEIGYGTYTHFQSKGYMTEAIGALIDWAAGQQDIKSIIAETDKNNIPSMRTLEKNNFVEFRVTESMIWWRRQIRT